MLPGFGEAYDLPMAAALTSINQSVLLQLMQAAAGARLPEEARFEASIERVAFAKGEALFHDGQAHPYVWGVRSGLVKFSYVDADGREWIKSFIDAPGYVASISSVGPSGRATFSAIALGDCALERLPFAVVQGLADTHLPWCQALLRMVMALAAKKEQREQELLTLSPAERYARLQDTPPSWLRQVSQKDLALYLGLTPVGLNRIIARHTKPS
jgi:CRP-like cAMP-binding protein